MNLCCDVSWIDNAWQLVVVVVVVVVVGKCEIYFQGIK